MTVQALPSTVSAREAPVGATPPRLAPRPGRWRFAARALVGLAITVLIFAGLSHWVDWVQLAALRREARWSVLGLGFALIVLLYALRTARFVLLAPRTPFPAMFCIAALHNLLLRVMPLRTGDLAFGFLVRRARTAGLGESLLGLVLLRLLDATVVVVVFGVTLALHPAIYRGSASVGLVVALALALAGGAVVVALPQLLRLGLRWIGGLARCSGLAERPWCELLLARLRGAIEAHVGLPRRVIAIQTGLTVAHWLLNYVIMLVILRGFGVSITLSQAILGGTASTVSGFLPIAGVGTFGPLEAGWALGFALVGLPPPLAVATGFAFSAVTFIYTALLAVPAWLLLDWTLRRAAPHATDPEVAR
ncbi:MAG: flippase-like domain-containing protein [Proteobacteria bacterium]|nr:flippase-like domain-containing protein [Pseudomonadota bacterium]